MAKQVLTHFHLADYFQFIGGASSDSLRVNKDDVIRYVMESCKLTEADRPSIVMVGDRRHDIFWELTKRGLKQSECFMDMEAGKSFPWRAPTGSRER